MIASLQMMASTFFSARLDAGLPSHATTHNAVIACTREEKEVKVKMLGRLLGLTGIPLRNPNL